MNTGFLRLPLEIRLTIYGLVFQDSNATFSAKRKADDTYPLLPADMIPLHGTQRGAQLLRTCKVVLFEAQPILYSRTRFHVTAHAFAGKLPYMVTNGHPTAPHVQHLVWQLDCDLMKHFYPDDLRLDSTALAELKTLELRCRAETWRNSFVGEWCDREAFVKGRDQMIDFGKILRAAMATQERDDITLLEDRRQLDHGRVVLRLESFHRHRVLNESVSASTLSGFTGLTGMQEVVLA